MKLPMFSAALQRLFPASPGAKRAPNKYWESIGILSLLAYSFFWLVNPDISGYAEGLLLLAFVWSFWKSATPAVRKDPLIYLFIGWVIFQSGVHLWAAQAFPDLAADQITVARHYTKVFMIFVVAWWLGGSINAVLAVLLATVFGLIIGSNINDGTFIDDFNKLLVHQRLDFGYRNWEHASVYCAFTLLTLLCFWRRILAYFPTGLRWLGIPLLALGVVFSLLGIVGTQTRATWLGLTISGSLVGFAWLFSCFLWYRGNLGSMVHSIRRPDLGLGIILVTLSLTGILAQSDGLSLLKERLNAERNAINTLLRGDFNDVPASTIRIRISTWRQALDWFNERPFTGWGPKSRKALYHKSDLPREIKQFYGHFHNSYIETAIAYGIVGVSTFALIIVLVGLRAWQAWRQGDLPNDLMLFGTLFFIYWLVVNSFESYIIYNTGIYLNAIIGGSLYTFHLARLQRVDVENPAKESRS